MVGRFSGRRGPDKASRCIRVECCVEKVQACRGAACRAPQADRPGLSRREAARRSRRSAGAVGSEERGSYSRRGGERPFGRSRQTRGAAEGQAHSRRGDGGLDRFEPAPRGFQARGWTGRADGRIWRAHSSQRSRQRQATCASRADYSRWRALQQACARQEASQAASSNVRFSGRL